MERVDPWPWAEAVVAAMAMMAVTGSRRQPPCGQRRAARVTKLGHLPTQTNDSRPPAKWQAFVTPVKRYVRNAVTATLGAVTKQRGGRHGPVAVGASGGAPQDPREINRTLLFAYPSSVAIVVVIKGIEGERKVTLTLSLSLPLSEYKHTCTCTFVSKCNSSGPNDRVSLFVTVVN